MFHLFILSLLFLVQACSDPQKERKSRLEEISLKMESIRTQIVEEQKKALDENVKSEGYMRADYAHFADSLEKAEASENRIHDLQGQLEKLQEEKSKLEKE